MGIEKKFIFSKNLTPKITPETQKIAKKFNISWKVWMLKSNFSCCRNCVMYILLFVITYKVKICKDFSFCISISYNSTEDFSCHYFKLLQVFSSLCGETKSRQCSLNNNWKILYNYSCQHHILCLIHHLNVSVSFHIFPQQCWIKPFPLNNHKISKQYLILFLVFNRVSKIFHGNIQSMIMCMEIFLSIQLVFF